MASKSEEIPQIALDVKTTIQCKAKKDRKREVLHLEVRGFFHCFFGTPNCVVEIICTARTHIERQRNLRENFVIVSSLQHIGRWVCGQYVVDMRRRVRLTVSQDIRLSRDCVCVAWGKLSLLSIEVFGKTKDPAKVVCDEC